MKRDRSTVALDVRNLPVLPPTWEWTTLSDAASAEKNAIVDGPFGSNLKLTDYIHPPGVPVLTTANLRGDYSPNKVRYISKEKFEELRRSEVRPGDILVAKIGSCGLTGIYPDDMPSAIIPANLLKMTPGDKALRKYIYYYLNSPLFDGLLKAIVTATAQPAFNVSKFKLLPFARAPLDQQHRIVAEIEKQFTRLDAGVASLKRVQIALKRYRASVLKAACEGRLVPTEAELASQERRSYEHAGELLARILEERRAAPSGRGRYKEAVQYKIARSSQLPEGWVLASIDQLFLNVTDGDHQPPPQSDRGVPLIVIGNLRKQRVNFESTRFVTRQYADSVDPYRKPRKGDILFSLVGSYGIAVQVKTNTEFCVQRHIAILRPHNQSPTRYLANVLNAPLVYQQASAVATGTAQKTVPLAGLRQIAIPLPPHAESERIVAEVERRLSLIEGLETAVAANLKRAERLRQSILYHAFTGNL